MATYRLTTLIRDDRVSEGLRRVVYRRFGSPDQSDAPKPSYLISCAWCLSLYAGGLAVLGRRVVPRAWAPLSAALAYSAATGLLTEARQQAAQPPAAPGGAEGAGDAGDAGDASEDAPSTPQRHAVDIP